MTTTLPEDSPLITDRRRAPSMRRHKAAHRAPIGALLLAFSALQPLLYWLVTHILDINPMLEPFQSPFARASILWYYLLPTPSFIIGLFLLDSVFARPFLIRNRRPTLLGALAVFRLAYPLVCLSAVLMNIFTGWEPVQWAAYAYSFLNPIDHISAVVLLIVVWCIVLRLTKYSGRACFALAGPLLLATFLLLEIQQLVACCMYGFPIEFENPWSSPSTFVDLTLRITLAAYWIVLARDCRRPPDHVLPLAPRTSHRDIADAPLAEDLPCAHCGYNLRTKRPSEHCPECGQPVAHAIQLARAPMRNPLRAARGAALLACWTAVLFTRWLAYTVATSVHPLSEKSLDTLQSINKVLYVAIAAIQAAGILWLAAGATRRPMTSRGKLALGLVRTAAVILILIAIATAVRESVGVAATGAGSGDDWDRLYHQRLLLSCSRSFLYLTLFLAGGWFLHKLARRQPWPDFSAATIIIFLLAFIDFALPAFMDAVHWLATPDSWYPSEWSSPPDWTVAFLPVFLAYWAILAARCKRLCPR